MLARERHQGNTQPMTDYKSAKRHLHEKGWSYRTAAVVLGVHYTHLARVLTGRRVSKSLLRRIYEIPSRQIQPQSRL